MKIQDLWVYKLVAKKVDIKVPRLPNFMLFLRPASKTKKKLEGKMDLAPSILTTDSFDNPDAQVFLDGIIKSFQTELDQWDVKRFSLLGGRLYVNHKKTAVSISFLDIKNTIENVYWSSIYLAGHVFDLSCTQHRTLGSAVYTYFVLPEQNRAKKIRQITISPHIKYFQTLASSK